MISCSQCHPTSCPLPRGSKLQLLSLFTRSAELSPSHLWSHYLVPCAPSFSRTCERPWLFLPGALRPKSFSNQLRGSVGILTLRQLPSLVAAEVLTFRQGMHDVVLHTIFDGCTVMTKSKGNIAVLCGWSTENGEDCMGIRSLS